MISQSLVSAWQRDPKEGERRAHRLEELAQMAFGEMRAAAARIAAAARPKRSSRKPPPARDERGELRVATRSLQRLLAVLAPDTPGRHAGFLRATTIRRSSTKKRSIAFCQEAIANALRHSGAANLTVRAQRRTTAGCVSKSRTTAAASMSRRCRRGTPARRPRHADDVRARDRARRTNHGRLRARQGHACRY